jgi:microcystin-dependent protein
MAVTTTPKHGLPQWGADTDPWPNREGFNAILDALDDAIALASQVFSSGDLKPVAYATTPTGWLECNGQTVSRTTYPSLFGKIGTAYNLGGESDTVFRLPDLRDKTAVGASATKALGTSGGSATTTLAVANLPAHHHDMPHIHDGASFSSFSNAAAGSAIRVPTTTETGPILDNTQTSDTGSATPFSNQSPYATVRWLIKV